MKSPLIFALLFAFALPLGLAAHAQQAGPVPTQALVNVDAKSTPPASASALTVSVNDKKEPLTAWEPVTPANAQVVLLIDDGLSTTTIGKELDNLRSFVRTLPPGVQITVGYMHNNKVSAFPLTADHELAASKLRLPQAMAGLDSNQELGRLSRALPEHYPRHILAGQGALHPDADRRRRSELRRHSRQPFRQGGDRGCAARRRLDQRALLQQWMEYCRVDVSQPDYAGDRWHQLL
jgi:hypothetical protein